MACRVPSEPRLQSPSEREVEEGGRGNRQREEQGCKVGHLSHIDRDGQATLVVHFQGPAPGNGFALAVGVHHRDVVRGHRELHHTSNTHGRAGTQVCMRHSQPNPSR